MSSKCLNVIFYPQRLEEPDLQAYGLFDFEQTIVRHASPQPTPAGHPERCFSDERYDWLSERETGVHYTNMNVRHTPVTTPGEGIPVEYHGPHLGEAISRRDDISIPRYDVSEVR